MKLKKILSLLLSISLIIELVLTFLCFFMPAKALALFGMQYNPQNAFLGFIIAWFCLLVSVIIAFATYLLQQNNSASKPLIYILGFWWVVLGIGVYMAYGKVDNILLDTIKGAVLIFLNYNYKIENEK